MHYERENLPVDVREIFFSDTYFYVASVAPALSKKALYVGCGLTREAATEDMRRLAGTAAALEPQTELRQTEPDVHTVLDAQQRETLALNLRALRQVSGLSQMHVARDVLGFQISHAFVSRLEAQQFARVETSRLERLAQFFGKSLSSLLSERPPAAPVPPGP